MAFGYWTYAAAGAAWLAAVGVGVGLALACTGAYMLGDALKAT
jgi:hypothetical protein